MSIWNIVGLIITVVIFIFVTYKLNRIQHDSFDRTQDLLRFKKISDDGIIELPEGIYRAVLEVEPVNMYLKTPDEQLRIWMQFRNMLNSIHIPITILVQSRHKDIKEYISELKESSKGMVTEELQRFGFELADYLETEISEKHVKDHRYYIVLEVNPHLRETDFEVPSEAVSQLMSSFQKPLSPEEAESLARQELQDHIAIIVAYLRGMGISVYRMDKNAVLEMAYSALNRDLAPVTDFSSIIYSSSIHTVSLTKEIIEKEKQAEKMEVINDDKTVEKEREQGTA